MRSWFTSSPLRDMAGIRWAVMVRVGHRQIEEYDLFDADTLDLQRSAGWEFFIYDDELGAAKPEAPDPLHGRNDSGGD